MPLLPGFELTNRTVLVTGASSGIGAELCRQAAVAGATVIGTGRHAERLARTIASLAGPGHRGVVADLTVEHQADALLAELPPLDGLVHCAGVQRFLPLKMLSRKAMAEIMQPILEAPLLLTRGVLARRLLRPGASVVFLSSLAASCAVPGNGIYSASKAALIAVARVLALELFSQRIRVNCVCPGMVRTPMAESMAAAISKEEMVRHEREYPLGFGEALDVAHAVVFLLSDASRWMTGHSLVLDGGYSLR